MGYHQTVGTQKHYSSMVIIIIEMGGGKKKTLFKEVFLHIYSWRRFGHSPRQPESTTEEWCNKCLHQRECLDRCLSHVHGKPQLFQNVVKATPLHLDGMDPASFCGHFFFQTLLAAVQPEATPAVQPLSVTISCHTCFNKASRVRSNLLVGVWLICLKTKQGCSACDKPTWFSGLNLKARLQRISLVVCD